MLQKPSSRDYRDHSRDRFIGTVLLTIFVVILVTVQETVFKAMIVPVKDQILDHTISEGEAKGEFSYCMK